MEVAVKAMGKASYGLCQSFPTINDSHTKWIEAYPTDSATSIKVIELSRTLFALFGIWEEIVTDNGSCFVSEELVTYLVKNGVKHITSAP